MGICSCYVELQQRVAMEDDGYSATRHQREVGAGYLNQVATVISGGTASFFRNNENFFYFLLIHQDNQKITCRRFCFSLFY